MALKKLFAVASLTLIPFGSLAEASPYSCNVYFEDDGDAPLDNAGEFPQVPNSALEVCAPLGESAADSNDAKFRLFFPPFRGELGACQVSRRSIFRKNGSWTYQPPSDKPHLANRSVSMMVSDDKCPRQDDPHYIVTNDITEGVFIAATRLWARISSGENLDELLGKLPSTIQSSTAFQSFEDAVKANSQKPSTLKLVSVDRFSRDPDRVSAHYLLTVNSSRDAWALVADFQDGGMRILSVGSVEY